MAAKVDKLNIFLSNLAVINVKIHNLHWNVVGPNFFVVHKMTEKLYQMFQLQYDQVAEMMKMQNQLLVQSKLLLPLQTKKYPPFPLAVLIL